MLIAMTNTRHPGHAGPGATEPGDVAETRLWMEEHNWLYALLRSSDNTAPTFRIPDLLSACVAIVFSRDDAAERIFGFLGTLLVMRPPSTPRRRESLWRAQYELLHDLQCSPANKHPNPKFQLDQLTTACVALCQHDDPSGAAVLRQARLNMVERHSGAHGAPRPER
ncbi:hypothetical protein [Xenophilus azovorans]|uniref:hypothetical protein n=1 Tax=Xenophilus azovorans TaxID=151755 RepID=UPI00056F50F7|nr:hypothetical protein [Xenophilus azovorans]